MDAISGVHCPRVTVVLSHLHIVPLIGGEGLLCSAVSRGKQSLLNAAEAIFKRTLHGTRRTRCSMKCVQSEYVTVFIVKECCWDTGHHT